jgi:membrane-associated phospholipid phosphatase
MRLRRWWMLCATLCCSVAAPSAFAIPGWEKTSTDVITGLIPVGTLYYTYKYDDGEGRKQFFWCVGTNEVVNSAARLAFNQTSLGKRPNGSGYGFPSGHVGFIASGASFLWHRYGWKYGVPAYAAVGFVGWERVATDHHRPRDVIASVALAETVAVFTVTAKKDPELTPVIGPGYVGVEWNHSFGGP